jgi:riboflavin synthase
MFTGIIEEKGELKAISRKGKTARVEILAEKLLADLKIGDSIAVNGICLTVTAFTGKFFYADISEETLAVSTASDWKVKMKLNLERAMLLSSRFSGHLVTGHADCIGSIQDKKDTKDFSVIHISLSPEYQKYIVHKGSIAIDGISLTVNEIKGGWFRVNIIPHTVNSTNLRDLRKGDKVNLEFDVIGKYVEKMLSSGQICDGKRDVSKETLLKAGFYGGGIL